MLSLTLVDVSMSVQTVLLVLMFRVSWGAGCDVGEVGGGVGVGASG